jgi:hypothetical protein
MTTNIYQFKPKNNKMTADQTQAQPEWDYRTAATMSYRNKSRIEADTPCGCYFCLTEFKGADVEDWTDDGETALCPRCDIDAVLPGVTEQDNLQAAHIHWFYGKADEAPGFCVSSEGAV